MVVVTFEIPFRFGQLRAASTGSVNGHMESPRRMISGTFDIYRHQISGVDTRIRSHLLLIKRLNVIAAVIFAQCTMRYVKRVSKRRLGANLPNVHRQIRCVWQPFVRMQWSVAPVRNDGVIVSLWCGTTYFNVKLRQNADYQHNRRFAFYMPYARR